MNERPPEPWMVALAEAWLGWTRSRHSVADVVALIQKHYQPPQPQPSAREERLRTSVGNAHSGAVVAQCIIRGGSGLIEHRMDDLIFAIRDVVTQLAAARKALEKKA